MKVIEVSKKEVRCGYCKSLLEINPNDIKTESSHFGMYICNVYYVCCMCKARNYNVPEDFKTGAKQEYERIKKLIY